MASYEQNFKNLRDIFLGTRKCSNFKEFKQLVYNTLTSYLIEQIGDFSAKGKPKVYRQTLNSINKCGLELKRLGLEVQERWFGFGWKIKKTGTVTDSVIQQLVYLNYLIKYSIETIEKGRHKFVTKKVIDAWISIILARIKKKGLVGKGNFKNWDKWDPEKLFELITLCENYCEKLMRKWNESREKTEEGIKIVRIFMTGSDCMEIARRQDLLEMSKKVEK